MENKDLLIYDLAQRLLYGVKVDVNGLVMEPYSINVREGQCQFKKNAASDGYKTIAIEDKHGNQVIKPYLKELSQMTPREYDDFKKMTGDRIFLDKDILDNTHPNTKDSLYSKHAVWDIAFNWLNKHHFDYRGLISKGLAIRVTEENNPY